MSQVDVYGLALMVVLSGAVIAWIYTSQKSKFSLLQKENAKLLESLEESHRQHELFLEKSGEGYVEVDLAGRIIEFNIHASRIFGLSKQEVLGAKFFETLVPERYRAIIQNGWNKYKSLGQMKVQEKQLELTGLCKDGREVPLEASISSTNKGFCAFLRDIGKRRTMELELNKALDQAIEASQSKSRFLANMSHEIRTPLNSVIGMLDLLLRSPITVSQREQAQIAFESAKSLLDVINDILDFSKIEAGKLEMEEMDFDLLHLIESTAEIMAQSAREKRIVLDAFLEPGCLRMLRGDPGRLRQVLLNLLSNAVKFTDKGYVLLSSSVDETHSVLNLSVRDSGIGMPQDEVGRLFQPFEQFDGSITRRWGGTGLGLSISKRLIELMEGEVEVKSKEGCGTEFSITLPLKKSEATYKEDSPPSRLRGARILSLSGLEDWSHSFSSLASTWGIETLIAKTSEEAQEILSRQERENKPVSLILADMYLPGELGHDAFSFLKEIEQRPHLNCKMILISPYSDEKLLKQALAGGFSDVLTRPLRVETLLASIVSVLGCDTDSGEVKIPQAQATAVKTTLPVLVAEDNPANRKLISIQLKKLGYSSYCVANGKEAVEAARRFHYALILMDVTMPEMDGFEASRSIRRNEEGTQMHVPIVAVTALAMKGDREKCLQAGMDDYLTKPIIYEELEKKLSQWINQTSSTGSVANIERLESEEAKLLTLKTGHFEMLKSSLNDSKPPIDLEKLNRIWMNDDSWKDLLTLFISELPEQLALLESYVQQRNGDLASDQAHNIKGCCLTFACDPMAGFAQKVEEASAQERWGEVDAAMSSMRLSCFQVRAFLVVSGMRKMVKNS
ncbi:MAG: response regulator [Candidatus Melainabacteria bacterium]|nr:response regulator [Candidatus Melainabacteria bacterium]